MRHTIKFVTCIPYGSILLSDLHCKTQVLATSGSYYIVYVEQDLY